MDQIIIENICKCGALGSRYLFPFFKSRKLGKDNKCLFFFNFKSTKKEVQASVHVNLFSLQPQELGMNEILSPRFLIYFRHTIVQQN